MVVIQKIASANDSVNYLDNVKNIVLANGCEAGLASGLSSAPCLPAGVRSPSGTDFPVGSAVVKKSPRLSPCPKHSLSPA